MNASFLALYKFGRYSSGERHVDLAEESSERKQQRERFAAAALGFTLKHSAAFRHQFLRAICGCPTEMLDIPVKVFMDDSKWGDLVIQSQDKEFFACVVETKIDAELEPHQDPWNEEHFLTGKKAYGRQIANRFGRDIRWVSYTVLEKQTREGSMQHENIHCFQRSWGELANVRHTENSDILIRDLFEALGQLGIPACSWLRFENMKTKEINIHNIQKMQAALQSIREHLGLAGKASRVNIGESEGTSWLGITLSPSSHGDLLNCGTKASVGWFGWEQLPEEDTAPCAGVWIYFDSKASARKALGCVKGAESWKQEDAALCLRKACSTLAEDNDWFKERVAEVMAAFKAKTFRWSMT